MKTKNSIILVSVICIVSLFLLSLYIPAYLQCSEGLQWDMSCSFPERTVSFEKFVKQKATTAFEMTLQKYHINSEQLTVQDGFRWNKEFFMAESIASDGNRYYLMTVFTHDLPIDKVDVQIFQIISEKCVTEHILNKQGCAPEYIRELKIPTISGVDYLLEQHGIRYLPYNLVVASGISIRGDSGCGAVIDTDSQIHWFGINSISEPKEITFLQETPPLCKVNTAGCYCDIHRELTTLTLDELSYFTLEEEEKYAEILIDYFGKENINRTPKFQIGKLNVNYSDSSAVGYCGELWGTNTYDFFEGAFVKDVAVDYSIHKEISPLCAISDDAQWWERK